MKQRLLLGSVLSLLVLIGAMAWLVLAPAEAPKVGSGPTLAVAEGAKVTAQMESVAESGDAEPMAAMRVVRFVGQAQASFEPAQWPALPDADVPVLALFDTLRARAEQGDASAACRLALELEQCRDLDSQRLAIERGSEVASIGAVAMIKSPEAQKERARFLLNRCSGLGDGHYRSAYDLTKRAALAGHRASLGRYLSGELFVADLGHNIDYLEDFRSEGPRLLEAAVQRGSLSALSMLANQPMGADSAVPEAVRSDPIEAASLKRLWQLVLSGMQGGRATADTGVGVERDQLMSAEDQAAAEALAQERLKRWFVETGSLAALQENARRPFDAERELNMNVQCTEGYDPAPDPTAPAPWRSTEVP